MRNANHDRRFAVLRFTLCVGKIHPPHDEERRSRRQHRRGDQPRQAAAQGGPGDFGHRRPEGQIHQPEGDAAIGQGVDGDGAPARQQAQQRAE